MTTIPEPQVVVAPSVLPPDDLAHRIAELRGEIDRHQGDLTRLTASTGALTVRARRLHEMWWTMAPPHNPSSRRVRGQIGHQVRRTTQRLVGWYVEPRLTAQREIDAELARFASDSAAALHGLQTEVDRLGGLVERLQRDVASLHDRSREGAP
ncbi:MAG: hypothetical protein R2743_26180 [Ilumatobacteraceae bacterium]